MSTTPASHTLYVTGMHCAACTVLITDILQEQGMTDVTVSLNTETVSFVVDTTDSDTVLAERCTTILAPHGYTCTTEPVHRAVSIREWVITILIVALCIGIFLSLDRLGVTAVLSGRDASVGTALLVGLVASVSTCLAVVGGLVLSLATAIAEKNAGVRPQIFFHLGRIVGFFVLGGLLGALGSVVHISVYGSAVLSMVVGGMMLLLGMQLLASITRVRIPTVSSTVFTRIRARIPSITTVFGATLVGVATFFLPCGFTQSMQVMALSSGSIVQGALIMTAFALGTFPVLALISFGSLDLAQSRYRTVFFKVAGILIMVFALYTLKAALTVLGIMSL